MNSRNRSADQSQFREVTWADVAVFQSVYIEGSTGPIGPYEVADPKNKLLRNVAKNVVFPVTDKFLLQPIGPPVVFTQFCNQITGCYADVPLDILIVTQDPDAGHGPALDCRQALRLDHVPTLDVKYLDHMKPGWRPLFGSWTVQHNETCDKSLSKTVSITLRNHLVLTQLFTYVTQQGGAITVESTTSCGTWVVTIPQHMMLEIENLHKGIFHESDIVS